MKKTTIFLSLLLALIFTFTGINADTLGIADIDRSSSYARESILALADMGIVKGDNLGNFNPTKSISRAEFVVMLARVLELDIENVPAKATFKDVPVNHWAFKYVEAAYKAGIVNGVTPTEFGVKKTSTREQIAVMFVRALNLVETSEEIQLKSIGALTDSSSIASWAKREVDIAMTAGLMNGVSNTTFAPKKYATKEQTAVVMDRFIKNENAIIEKINTTYGVNGEVKLILNGDTVTPEMYTVDENKNVFVGEAFIEKYVLNNSMDVLEIGNGEIFILTEGEYVDKNIFALWFKEGSKNAYKNTGMGTEVISPYTNEEQNTANQITLETAPIAKDGEVLVPAKDLANILGAAFTFDAARNRAIIEDANIDKYPNLYGAVKKGFYEKYVGDVEIIAEMNMTDLVTKEFAKTYSEIFSTINSTATQTYTYMKLETNADEPLEFETEYIMTADKVYELDYDDKWIEYSRSEWESTGGAGVGDPLTGEAANEGDVISKEFYQAYRSLPIVKAGTVKLDEVTADKYVISLDSQGVKTLLQDEKYNELKELLDTAYQGTLRYDIEFYVADGQIVREVVKFSGQAADSQSGANLEIKMTVDVYYSNIGVNSEIVLPNPSEIKQPEQY